MVFSFVDPVLLTCKLTAAKSFCKNITNWYIFVHTSLHFIMCFHLSNPSKLQVKYYFDTDDISMLYK